MALNPFNDTKLEYELEPVLWFSKRSKKIAQRGKATFVSGTRGSGKTSILRSLSTRYISDVESLNEQMSNTKLEWFGVYIRLQDAFADIIKGSISRDTDSIDGQPRKDLALAVFSQYIELLVLSAISRDLIELRAKGFLKFSAGSEYDAIQRLFSGSQALRGYASGEQPETLRDLESLCQGILHKLFSAAIGVGSRLPIDVLKAGVPGEIIASTAKSLVPIIRGDRFKQGSKLLLKIMIDDCEILSQEHQTYLNTLIRNSTQPISWVIAYIESLYDARRTSRPNQMLSDADREIEFLDNYSESEFRELCTRISSLRLYRSISPEGRRRAGINGPNSCFDLDARLGKPSLNELIDASFQTSLSSEVQALRDHAQRWRVALEAGAVPNDLRSELEFPPGSLPYTVAFAAESIGLGVEDAMKDLQDDTRRRRLQRILARKQRAAFLVIGRQNKTRMILAGSGIVLALSDGCIRDFLDIMRAIFDNEKGDLDEGKLIRFVKSKEPIRLARQSAAIYKASEQKLSSVMTIADPYGEGVTRLITALGKLTAELQTNDGAMRNPETGIFRVNWRTTRNILKRLGRQGRDLDELFRKSELDGFVREVDAKDVVAARPQIEIEEYRLFRLHRRFAPAFGFSFRGPYGVTVLPESALVEAVVADGSFSIGEWIRRTLSRADSVAAPNQMELPGFADRPDDV